MTIISHDEVFHRCKKIARSISHLGNPVKVYPVPRGGVPVAYALSLFLPIEIVNNPKEADVIVDDIIDSEATLKRFEGKPFFALYNKNIDYKLGWIVFPWEETEEKSIEDALIRILQFIGEDPAREGLLETPARVAKSFKELFAGYSMDVKDQFKTFDVAYDELVIIKDIELYSTCEHHMLPFTGRTHIAYIANGKVIGASKLARILEVFSRRLQVQERIGVQVVESLMEHLKPKGAACIIEAKHFCMCSRGIGKQHSVMTTSTMRGIFLEDTPKGMAARAELMSLLK